MDELKKILEDKYNPVREVPVYIKGEKGDDAVVDYDTIIEESVSKIQSAIDYDGIKEEVKELVLGEIKIPIPENGKDYIITEKDKKDIALLVDIPTVETIVEKTETIIEKPIENPETGESIVEKINELPTDTNEYKIDASHIKNLPEPKVIRGGGSTARNFFQLQDTPNDYSGAGGYKVKVKADESGLEFLADTGGGGGSVDSVVGGTGIDVDATDPANPIVNINSTVEAILDLATTAVQNLSDLGITADATELNYVDGVTSSIQTQLNAKLGTTLANTNIFVGDGSNIATAVAMSGDATIANTGALTIANNAVNYAKMQDVSATARVLGRVTAGSGDVEEIVIDTDLSSVSASDDTVASAKAIKTYVDSRPIAIFSANYTADIAVAGVSRFLALTSAGLPDSGTENQRDFPVPVAGTAKNFYFTTTTAQSGTGSLVLTIRKNGADTAIQITIAAGSAAGQFSDTTNTESFAAGDTLSVKVTNNASTNSAAYNGASLAFF